MLNMLVTCLILNANVPLDVCEKAVEEEINTRLYAEYQQEKMAEIEMPWGTFSYQYETFFKEGK